MVEHLRDVLSKVLVFLSILWKLVRELFLFGGFFKCHEEIGRMEIERELMGKIERENEKKRREKEREKREVLGDVLKYEDRICALTQKIFELSFNLSLSLSFFFSVSLSVFLYVHKKFVFNNNTAAATVIHWIQAFVTLFKWIPVLGSLTHIYPPSHTLVRTHTHLCTHTHAHPAMNWNWIPLKLSWL